MGTVNVGALAARFGLDSSEFLEKIKGAEGASAFASNSMQRQWKESARHGTESLRLLDENIGLHLSRPLTRLISETFPNFSKALAGILGATAVGAVGGALLELGEHLSKGLDEAKRKEEEYTEAVRNTKTALADAGAENERRLEAVQARLAGALGNTEAEQRYKILELEADGVQQLAKEVDTLGEKERKEAAAALARSGYLEGYKRDFGANLHALFTSASDLGVENVDKEFERTLQRLHDLSEIDITKHSNESAKALRAEVEKTGADLEAMKKVQLTGLGEFLRDLESAANLLTVGAVPFGGIKPGVSSEEVAHKQAIFDMENDLLAKKEQIDAGTAAAKQLDAVEAGRAAADQLRAELDAVAHSVTALQLKASAEETMAAATGKGAQASIMAAGAMEAERVAAELQASFDEKYIHNTQDKIGASKRFHEALDAAVPKLHEAALAEVAFHAVQEQGQKISEFSTHADERLAELNEEANGYNNVAKAQAEQAKSLAESRKGLEGDRGVYEAMKAALTPIQLKALTAGFVGPLDEATGHVAAFKAAIDQAQKAFDSLAGKSLFVQATIQDTAFKTELKKLQEEAAAEHGAAISPWAKKDAELKKYIHDLEGLGGVPIGADQVAQLKTALYDVQTAHVEEAFSKLDDKIAEVRASNAALASGSPYGKVDAEVVKLAADLGLVDEKQLDILRNKQLEIFQGELSGKVLEGVGQYNPSGAKLQEIELQIAAAKELARQHAFDGDIVKSTQLYIQQLTTEEDNLLLKTQTVGAGFRAWLNDQAVAGAEAGKSTFDALNEGLKGWEDHLVETLTTGRGHWHDYFTSLENMAFKIMLKQFVGFGAGLLEKAVPNPAAQAAKANQLAGGSTTGIKGILATFLGAPKSAGSAAQNAGLSTAGTVLHSAGDQLISAAEALHAAAIGAHLPGLEAPTRESVSRGLGPVIPLPPGAPSAPNAASNPLETPSIGGGLRFDAASILPAALSAIPRSAGGPVQSIAAAVKAPISNFLSPPKSAGNAARNASLSTAGTILHSAGAELISAAAALRAVASFSGGPGGASAGGVGGFLAAAGPFVGGFAEGGDVTPGHSFISGEAGAERVDLSPAGAHITPLGTGAGGDTHLHYDMRGAVVTDDLMRKADAVQLSERSARRAVGQAVSTSKEIGLRTRPGS